MLSSVSCEKLVVIVTELQGLGVKAEIGYPYYRAGKVERIFLGEFVKGKRHGRVKLTVVTEPQYECEADWENDLPKGHIFSSNNQFRCAGSYSSSNSTLHRQWPLHYHSTDRQRHKLLSANL